MSVDQDFVQNFLNCVHRAPDGVGCRWVSRVGNERDRLKRVPNPIIHPLDGFEPAQHLNLAEAVGNLPPLLWATMHVSIAARTLPTIRSGPLRCIQSS